MSPRESRTIELALHILEKATKAKGDDPVRTDGVQLALRVLLPYVNKSDLVSFWRITDNPNAAQRSHNLRRTLDGVRVNAIWAKKRG